MREVLVALLLVACSSSEAATPRAEVDSGADAAFDSGADAALESGADAAADSGADAPGLPACPSFAEPVAAGVVDAPAITEASGIVAGSTGYWVHNDSGDSPRVFHLDAQGQLTATVNVSGAQAVDWEDIARAPGVALYLGDIGDNAKQRSSVRVYRIPEPTAQSVSAEALTLTYPEGKAWNAETLLVDPLSGDLYIVTKEVLGSSPVFRAGAPLAFGGSMELEQVAVVDFAKLGGGTLATRGDVSPDGSLVVVRTYGTAFAWRRPAGARLEAAFATEPCPLPLAKEPQGEAIGFSHDGTSLLTVSEGTSPTLYRSDRL